MTEPPSTQVHDGAETRPWWRHGMVWLVIGGPALVVVAALATAVIAYSGAEALVVDPPSSKSAAGVRPGPETPALQARNHAATPASR